MGNTLESLLEVLSRVEAGKPVTEAWIREHYPTSSERILRALRAEDALAPPPFDRIGPYAVTETVGRGPHGTVYFAEVRGPGSPLPEGREVALKVLREHVIRGSDYADRLDASLALEHPGLLPLLDAATEDGLTYLVMDRARGPTLREALERGIADEGATAARLLREAGPALEALHDAGIAHGDIKPENMLLGEKPCLMEVGLVPLWTAEGGVRPRGTELYLAPEIRSGGRPSVRTDLYSLGAVLFEVLAGQPPAAELIEDPPRGLDPALAAQFRRLLAEAPDRRPGSVRELAGAFEILGRETGARPDSAEDRS